MKVSIWYIEPCPMFGGYFYCVLYRSVLYRRFHCSTNLRVPSWLSGPPTYAVIFSLEVKELDWRHHKVIFTGIRIDIGIKGPLLGFSNNRKEYC